MRAGLGAEEVRRRLARAARHEEAGCRVRAFYLVETDVRRLYQATRHGSTAYYAQPRRGLDRLRTAELLRVGAKLLEHVGPWLFQRGLARMTRGGRRAASCTRLLGVQAGGHADAPNVRRSAGRAYDTS